MNLPLSIDRLKYVFGSLFSDSVKCSSINQLATFFFIAAAFRHLPRQHNQSPRFNYSDYLLHLENSILPFDQRTEFYNLAWLQVPLLDHSLRYADKQARLMVSASLNDRSWMFDKLYL